MSNYPFPVFPLLDKIQELNKKMELGSALFGDGIRRLKPEEISLLKENHNHCPQWESLWVSNDFSPRTIWSSYFSPDCILGKAEILSSRLLKTEVGSGSSVVFCPKIEGLLLEGGGTVENSTFEVEENTQFGNGIELNVGLETGGRKATALLGFLLDHILESVRDAAFFSETIKIARLIRSNFNFVGSSGKISGVGLLRGVWITGQVTLKNCSEVKNSSLIGTPTEPTLLGSGVQLRNCLVNEGCEIASSAFADTAYFCEHAGAEKKVLISHSVLGPDTHCAEGEITSSLLGPFVGFHHQSLLIAAWWPLGRGNIAYGANIGSNHTSRLADQEIEIGEGVFFGLSTSVKFPSNFSFSPYSIISTGVITNPQRVAFPFSLFLPGEHGSHSNRLIPGWVLGYNLYSVLRNEEKYRERKSFRRHQFDLRVFRPETVDNLCKALAELESCWGKDVYTIEDFPSMGMNYLLEKDRTAAIRTYREYAVYALLKINFEKDFFGTDYDLKWFEQLSTTLGLQLNDRKSLLLGYFQAEKRVFSQAKAALGKDWVKGKDVISDYEVTHKRVEEDPFLVNYQEKLQKKWNHYFPGESFF